MRALSVRQPWPWAIINGYKDVENRSWRTQAPQPLLVHAGKTVDPLGFHFLWKKGLHRLLPEELPLGKLLGTIEVKDIVSGYPSPWAFRGAWHWVLAKPREFRNPIPSPGGQRIFIPKVSAASLGGAKRYAIAHRRRS